MLPIGTTALGLSCRRTTHLQATFNQLLSYCMLRPTQPLTLGGMGNE